MPSKDLNPPRAAAAAAATDLQKARTQIADGKYVDASNALGAARSGIEAQIRAVDASIEARTARPVRRRGGGG